MFRKHTMLKTLAKPAPAAAASEPDLRYLADRQFGAQWRGVLLSLAAELSENFSADEAKGFFRQIGVRAAAAETLQVVETIDGLEAILNTKLAELDWGYAALTVEDGAIVIRHRSYPGQHLEGGEIWRQAYGALLEGVYTVWLQTQGGRAEMEAKLRNDLGVDGFEFAYGL